MLLHSVIFMGVAAIIACKIAGSNHSNMNRKSLHNDSFPEASSSCFRQKKDKVNRAYKEEKSNYAFHLTDFFGYIH